MATGTSRLPVRLLKAAAVVGAAAALFVGGATMAAAATGTVHTSSGAPLNVHTSPSTGSSVTASVASGAAVQINCQITGTTVSGLYGTSNLWDHITSPANGYVSDTYVYTGSSGQVAPTCGSGGGGSSCSTSGTGDPHSCAQAVAWAKAHVSTSYNGDYYRRCDHVVGLAYGFSASGSVTAYAHWTAIPSGYRHSGDTNVPAGGLAFFSDSGAGHVMISVGGGQFISNDIHGAGTYTYTTIAEIQRTWGQHYLGWAQPWFQANH